jgi:hypothetical protein
VAHRDASRQSAIIKISISDPTTAWNHEKGHLSYSGKACLLFSVKSSSMQFRRQRGTAIDMAGRTQLRCPSRGIGILAGQPGAGDWLPLRNLPPRGRKPSTWSDRGAVSLPEAHSSQLCDFGLCADAAHRKIVGWSAGMMAKMAARWHFGIEERRRAVEAMTRTPNDVAGESPRFHRGMMQNHSSSALTD